MFCRCDLRLRGSFFGLPGLSVRKQFRKKPRAWVVFSQLQTETIAINQYELLAAGKFNDTPILVGTNSDEGGLFVTHKMTGAAFEQMIRKQYAAAVDVILKAYPHATDAEATKSAKDIFRDSTFAWPTWAWATLQSKNGKNKVLVYYFDHRPPCLPRERITPLKSPTFLGTSAEWAAGGARGDKALSDLISAYWVNFARNGDPNDSGLPAWPTFVANEQKTMIFDSTPGARPLPNMDKIKAFDEYFAKLREEAKTKK